VSISGLNFWILQASFDAMLYFRCSLLGSVHDPTISHIRMFTFLWLLLFPLYSSSCPYPCPHLVHAFCLCSKTKNIEGEMELKREDGWRSWEKCIYQERPTNRNTIESGFHIVRKASIKRIWIKYSPFTRRPIFISWKCSIWLVQTAGETLLHKKYEI